jgi:hypothetical protein
MSMSSTTGQGDGESAAIAQAILAALDDMKQGDLGQTLAEFDQQFRAKHGLPKRPAATVTPDDLR